MFETLKNLLVEELQLDPDEIMVPGALVDLIVQAEMEG